MEAKSVATGRPTDTFETMQVSAVKPRALTTSNFASSTASTSSSTATPRSVKSGTASGKNQSSHRRQSSSSSKSSTQKNQLSRTGSSGANSRTSIRSERAKQQTRNKSLEESSHVLSNESNSVALPGVPPRPAALTTSSMSSATAAERTYSGDSMRSSVTPQSAASSLSRAFVAHNPRDILSVHITLLRLTGIVVSHDPKRWEKLQRKKEGTKWKRKILPSARPPRLLSATGSFGKKRASGKQDHESRPLDANASTPPPPITAAVSVSGVVSTALFRGDETPPSSTSSSAVMTHVPSLPIHLLNDTSSSLVSSNQTDASKLPRQAAAAAVWDGDEISNGFGGTAELSEKGHGQFNRSGSSVIVDRIRRLATTPTLTTSTETTTQNTSAGRNSYRPERVNLRVNLLRGDEMVPIGLATILVTGRRDLIELELPVSNYGLLNMRRKESNRAKKKVLSNSKNGVSYDVASFASDDYARTFGLEDDAKLRVRIVVTEGQGSRLASGSSIAHNPRGQALVGDGEHLQTLDGETGSSEPGTPATAEGAKITVADDESIVEDRGKVGALDECEGDGAADVISQAEGRSASDGYGAETLDGDDQAKETDEGLKASSFDDRVDGNSRTSRAIDPGKDDENNEREGSCILESSQNMDTCIRDNGFDVDVDHEFNEDTDGSVGINLKYLKKQDNAIPDAGIVLKEDEHDDVISSKASVTASGLPGEETFNINLDSAGPFGDNSPATIASKGEGSQSKRRQRSSEINRRSRGRPATNDNENSSRRGKDASASRSGKNDKVSPQAEPSMMERILETMGVVPACDGHVEKNADDEMQVSAFDRFLDSVDQKLSNAGLRDAFTSGQLCFPVVPDARRDVEGKRDHKIISIKKKGVAGNTGTNSRPSSPSNESMAGESLWTGYTTKEDDDSDESSITFSSDIPDTGSINSKSIEELHEAKSKLHRYARRIGVDVQDLL